MLKLTANALGMLIAKYRAVFKKCFWKNAVALAAASFICCAAPAPAAATVSYYNATAVTTTIYPNLAALRAVVSSFNNNDKVTIDADDNSLTGAFTIAANRSVTIDFLGSPVNISPASTGIRFLNLSAGATVTFDNASQASIEGFGQNGTYFNYGGAIYAYGANVTVNAGGATFKSNYVSDTSTTGYTYSYGGAVYNNGSNSALNANGATFDSNYVSATSNVYASGNGGAVYLEGSSILNADSTTTFYGNSASGTGGAGSGYGYGGAVFITGGTAYADGATFDSNSASGTGGSGTGYGGAVFITGSSSTLNANNAKFNSNDASGSTYGFGGAVSLISASTLNAAGATFTSNHADGSSYGGSGGAIYASNGTNADVIGATFDSNYVTGSNNGSGGAIYTVNTPVNADGADFKTNRAIGSSRSEGGAIYASNNSIVSVIGATFSDNYVTGSTSSSSGGAVVNGGYSTLNADNAIFISNYAASSGTSYGGAIANTTSGIANVKGATFTSNSAAGSTAGYGGAVYLSDGTLNAEDAQFQSNTATTSGGAIYSYASSAGTNINLGASAGNTSTFSGNLANGQANSIYFAGSGGNTNNLTIDGDGTLDMLDPMNSSAAGYSINITKNGNGTWKLGGDNVFNAYNMYGTTFIINAGTLDLYQNASITINTAGSFTLGDGASNAKLISDGSNTITTPSIKLENGSILGFDLTGATTADTSLTFNGAFQATSQTIGSGVIEIYNSGSNLAYGTYTLVDASGSSGAKFTTNGTTLYYNSSLISTTPTNRSAYALYLLADTSTLKLDVANTAINTSLTWTGTSSSGNTDVWDVNNESNWTGNVVTSTGTYAVTQFLDGDDVRFDDTGATQTITVAAASPATAVTVGDMTVDNSIYDYTFSGDDIDGDSLIKEGSGTLTLKNASNFATSISIKGGRVNIDNSNALTGSDIAMSADTILGFIGSYSLSNDIILDGDATVDTAVHINELSGDISGTGGLTKIGTGSLTLSGSNTYNGRTDVTDGTLIGNIANNTALTVAGGAIYDTGSGTLADDRTVSSLNGAGTVNMNGKDLTVGEGSFSGAITGSGSSLVKDTVGTLTLTGTNTYSGDTDVTAGILIGNIANNTALTVAGGAIYDTGTGTLADDRTVSALNSAGTVNMNGKDLTVGQGSFSGAITGSGSSLIKDTAGTLTLTGTNTYSGSTDVTDGLLIGNIANNTDLTVALGATYDTGTGTLADDRTVSSLNGDGTVSMNGKDLTVGQGTFNGTITGSGSSLIKDTAGTLTLTGANTYSGSTDVTDGILIGNIANNTDLTVASGATYDTGSGTLAADRVLASLNGTGTVNMEGQSLTVGQGDFSGGTLLNVDKLTKDTANTFTVGTATVNSVAVDDGTLAIAANETLTVNGLIEVANNATLSVIAGANPSVVAGSVDFGSLSVLDVGGYSGSQLGDTVTLITSNTAVTNMTNHYTIGGSTTVDYLTAQVYLSADQKAVLADVALAWYDSHQDSSGQYDQAHGTFTVDGAFEVVTSLADRSGTFTTNSWDGQTLTKAGTGTLTLSGSNTYSGGTNLNKGRITIGNDSALGTGALTMANDTTLGFAGNYTIVNDITLTGNATIDTSSYNNTLNGIIGGAGSLTKDGTGILTLTNSNTYSGGTVIDDGTLVSQNADALGSGLVQNNAALTLDFNGTFANALQGTGSLTTNGTITISSNNSGFSGSTTIASDTLTLGNANALGSGSVTMADNTTLNLAGSYTLSNDITLSGSATIDTQSYNDTLTGIIGGAGSLTKEGTGTLTLANSNTYSGGTVIDDGTLVSQDADALGSGLVQNNAALSLDFNGTFANALQGAGSLTTNGNITISHDNSSFSGNTTIASDTLTLTDANALGSGLVQNNAALSLDFDGTFANALQGAGSLTTSGNIAINQANSGFSGSTTIASDTLTLGDANAIGAGDVTMADNTTLGFAGSYTFVNDITLTGNATIDTQSSNDTLTGTIDGVGSLTKDGTGTLTLTNSNTYSGGTVIDDGTLVSQDASALGSGVVQTNAALILDFNGTFANELQGAGSLTTNGNIAINRDNSGFSGDTTIAANTLTLGDANALGTGLVENNAALILDFNGTFANELQGGGDLTTNGTITISSDNSGFSGDTTITANTLTLSAENALGTGLVTNNAALNLDFDGTFVNDIQGTGELIKSGSGEVILSGNNTYSGDTVIEDGTLTINNVNSLSASSAIVNNSVLNLLASSTGSTTYNISSYSGTGTVGIQASVTAQGQWSDILNFSSTPQSVNVHFYFTDGSSATYLSDDGIQFAHLSTNDGTDNTFALNGISSLAGASQLEITTSDYQDYYLISTFNPSLAKVYSEASAAQLSQASWMHNRELFKVTEQASRQADGHVPGIAVGFSRNDFRQETGSHADIDGNTLAMALAFKADDKTTWGIYGQKFDGSYRTSHNVALSSGDHTIHSDGDLKTHDIGLFAEYRPSGEAASGYYYQAFISAGRSTNDFSADNTSSGVSTFRSGRDLFSASLGGGYVKDSGKGESTDYYSHLIYTRLGSDSVTDSIGQNIDLQSSESVRLLSGVKFNFNQNRKTKTYFGVALDYEFSGKVNAYIGGLKADSADIKGLTGILEFGLTANQNDIWTIDFGLQGYMGKKEGLGGMVTVSTKF